ncbi:AraC family transcriptional regulator [Microbacterium sp. LWH12-1.2]|uniref:AraC family transcriptional regulator n=1 Tax=Microbacterium sp. LWH12-1.2 TaxID=3135259 RepID=UPI00343190E8
MEVLVYSVETLTTRDPSQRIQGEWWMSQVSSLLAPHRVDLSTDWSADVVRQRSTRYQVVGWREECPGVVRSPHKAHHVPPEVASFYIPFVNDTGALSVSGARDSGRPWGALVCADSELLELRDGNGFAYMALIIHRDRVRMPPPDNAGDPAPLHLDLSRGIGRILKDQLRLVHQERDHLDVTSFDLMLDHVVDLLVMLANPASTEPPTELSWALLASLRQIIRERAHDPALDGFALAARLGWSLRHVQAQLRLHGTTPSDLIREERLKVARRLLKDPESRALSIGQISTASGFRDLSTFSNSYQRRYGERPSATRVRRITTPVPTRAIAEKSEPLSILSIPAP